MAREASRKEATLHRARLPVCGGNRCRMLYSQAFLASRPPRVAGPYSLAGRKHKMGNGRYSTNLLDLFESFWGHKALILQMTKREVIGRYRGSVMGLLWSFLNPVLMLAVYTLVFGVVFKARWGAESGSKADFAIILFVGMIIHSLLAECVNRAPGLMLSNVNYIKKVVFPLDILPWVTMASALFHAMVSIGVLLIFFVLVHQYLHWTAIFFPLLLVPYVLFVMGLSWFLSATGVYLRDLGQITGLATTVLMFLSPIFFPASALPQEYRLLMHLNPLTFVIEQSRGVLIWGKLPDWSGLAAYLAFGVVTAWAGFYWFQKTRKGFADVL